MAWEMVILHLDFNTSELSKAFEANLLINCFGYQSCGSGLKEEVTFRTRSFYIVYKCSKQSLVDVLIAICRQLTGYGLGGTKSVDGVSTDLVS